MNLAAKKRVYLLVTFKESNSDMEQLLFELALKYNAFVYTSKEQNSFIIDASPANVHRFRHRISTLPIKVKMLLEK